jgi:hypothetical protein
MQRSMKEGTMFHGKCWTARTVATFMAWGLLLGAFGGLGAIALADVPTPTVEAGPPVLPVVPALDEQTAKDIGKIGTLIATKQWSLLFPLVLTLLAGILKGPRGIQFISNVPPKFRALAVTAMGAILGTPTLMAYGLSFWTAFAVSTIASLAAPGAYEVWKGATGKPSDPDAAAKLDALQKQVDAAKKITDPGKMAEAVKALGNAV